LKRPDSDLGFLSKDMVYFITKKDGMKKAGEFFREKT
jgi:hypothetical protein